MAGGGRFVPCSWRSKEQPSGTALAPNSVRGSTPVVNILTAQNGADDYVFPRGSAPASTFHGVTGRTGHAADVLT